MALPTGNYGITLGITPAVGVWKLELQRSSGTVGDTDFVLIATITTHGSTFSYQDYPLPDDNGIRNYRARHTYPGYTASAWSTRISARPVDIGEILP